MVLRGLRPWFQTMVLRGWGPWHDAGTGDHASSDSNTEGASDGNLALGRILEPSSTSIMVCGDLSQNARSVRNSSHGNIETAHYIAACKRNALNLSAAQHIKKLHFPPER